MPEVPQNHGALTMSKQQNFSKLFNLVVEVEVSGGENLLAVENAKAQRDLCKILHGDTETLHLVKRAIAYAEKASV